MFTNKELILSSVLKCNLNSLESLENIEYDVEGIVETLLEQDSLNFNEIWRRVLNLAFSDLMQRFLDSYSELLKIVKLEDKRTLADIRCFGLNYEIDIGHEGIIVYLEEIDFFKKYLSIDLEIVENKTGLKFS